jgi:Zn-dependent peptidase ImmA (M78 family)
MKTTSSHTEHFPLLKEFISYVKDFLKLNSLPPVTFSYSSVTAKNMCSFGGYNITDKSISLNVANRHQADVFRTLAHELVHYKQDLENSLYDGAGETGSPIENEANAEAAVIMRNFARSHPEVFIIK